MLLNGRVCSHSFLRLRDERLQGPGRLLGPTHSLPRGTEGKGLVPSRRVSDCRIWAEDSGLMHRVLLPFLASVPFETLCAWGACVRGDKVDKTGDELSGHVFTVEG